MAAAFRDPSPLEAEKGRPSPLSSGGCASVFCGRVLLGLKALPKADWFMKRGMAWKAGEREGEEEEWLWMGVRDTEKEEKCGELHIHMRSTSTHTHTRMTCEHYQGPIRTHVFGNIITCTYVYLYK